MFNIITRITSFILILCFCASAVSCGGGKNNSSENSLAGVSEGSGVMSEIISDETSDYISEESFELTSVE
jgi:hypothetical protein